MNALVAQMMGTAIREDDSVPVPAARQQTPSRRRTRSEVRRGTAAAMMGMAEEQNDGEESIIPSDAEEIDGVNGPSGIKLDQKMIDRDKDAEEPDHPITPDQDAEQLMTPRDALVAPDVTPQAFEPIDPSDVPAPKSVPQPKPAPAPVVNNQPEINPMDVLLGRVNPRPGQSQIVPPPEQVVTAESAQATVNTVLGVNGGSGDLLKQSVPMPDPTPSQPGKIMETFFKYGPRPGSRS